MGAGEGNGKYNDDSGPVGSTGPAVPSGRWIEVSCPTSALSQNFWFDQSGLFVRV